MAKAADFIHSDITFVCLKLGVLEFLMLKLCYAVTCLPQGMLISHVILGVKTPSAVSRYSFLGSHVQCVEVILVHVVLLLLPGFCAGSWHE